MDISTLVGFIVGFGSIYIGYTMDGGKVGSLMMLSATVCGMALLWLFSRRVWLSRPDNAFN